MNLKRVSILGATGSIGLSTLDVIAQHPEQFSVFALSANNRHDLLLQQCLRHEPQYAVMVCENAARELERALANTSLVTEVLAGAEALSFIASHQDADIVMAAIVGAAGLSPSLAAAEAGKKVLLANKESLVVSGHLFMEAVAKNGATLLPIDSEHNAIYQCLPNGYRCGSSLEASVRKVLLTASGGPFRNKSVEELSVVTPEQACKHPNWDMGRKISVDSASLMNKGLELIEACWLFDISPKQIEVVVHPESVVHSMVQYSDGSVLAQLGNPDMRTPIAYGLAWPERIDSGVKSLDLVSIAQLNFEHPDELRFPCLRLAKEAFLAGGTACAVLNAANEVAVEAFLKGNIGFMAIPDIIEDCLSHMNVQAVCSIEQLLDTDLATRSYATSIVARR